MRMGEIEEINLIECKPNAAISKFIQGKRISSLTNTPEDNYFLPICKQVEQINCTSSKLSDNENIATIKKL